jgi:hypothetical protein
LPLLHSCFIPVTLISDSTRPLIKYDSVKIAVGFPATLPVN